jgi:sugar/nucleoside kinase (ribokinase family)
MASDHVGRAVVAGHICLDIIPGLSHLAPGQFATSFRPGQLIEVGPAVFSTGGPVSNTGLALHTLGVPTQLMGKLGADLFGQAVRDIVSSYGQDLAAGMLVDEHSSTSYSLIISPPGQDRTFLHHPGANDTFCGDDVRYAKLAGADIFHFGYPPIMRRMYEDGGAELAQVFQRAKAMGVTTSLDLAFPDPASPGGRANWPAILRAALPQVDVFLPSIEELLFMLRRETFDSLQQAAGGRPLLDLVTPEQLTDISTELLAMGVKIVVLKLGERGLYLRTSTQTDLAGLGRAGPPDAAAWARRELWAPCFQVEVVGTTGSGDATIAGFLSALLRGLSPEQTLTAAVAVGACNVEAADALSGLRSWEATLARITGGWARRPLSISALGWRWQAEPCGSGQPTPDRAARDGVLTPSNSMLHST